MKTIHAVIIDREQNSINTLLQMLIKHCTKVNIVATANSIPEGESLILLHKPNLIIVAIEMHEGNEFQLFDHLLPNHYSIIFTSTKRASTIFPNLEYNAFHYLLKPFDDVHLSKAIYKVELFINEQKKAIAANDLQKSTLPIKQIYLHSTNTIKAIWVSDIMYIKTLNHCTEIYTEKNEKNTSNKTLHHWIALFINNGFIKINNGCLLNPLFIDQYNKGRGGTIQLKNNTKLEVSEAGWKELKKLFF